MNAMTNLVRAVGQPSARREVLTLVLMVLLCGEHNWFLLASAQAKEASESQAAQERARSTTANQPLSSHSSESAEPEPASAENNTTAAIIAAALARAAVSTPPVTNTITDAAISRHKPTLNAGSIDGSLRVFSGETFTINASHQLTGDLYTVGTPTITNNNSTYGGTVNDGGSATPNNYQVILNGTTMGGKIHTRADAISLPADIPTSVPAASGTRIVNVNKAADVSTIGSWTTLRDLNVSTSGTTINVPPGNYGTFTLNGSSQLNFTAGVYNFTGTINLNGNSTLNTTGEVTINIGQNLNVNSGSIVPGSFTSPGNVRLNVIGSSLTINGNSQVTALVRAVNATVILNGSAQLRGQVIANYLNVNAGTITGAVWPSATGNRINVFGPRRFDRTTGSPNQYTEQFSLPPCATAPYNLHVQNGSSSGTNRISSATVKLNGATILSQSDFNQNVSVIDRTVTLTATNTLDVSLASSPGSYLTITISGGNCAADTTPPAVAITAPANNSTTTASQTSVSGTASDPGSSATGIAHVYVNGIEAAYNAANSTWTLASLALNVGANQITAQAVDNAGNQATAQITVTRQQVPVDTTPPTNSITTPANNSTTQAASITVSGTAVDPGTNASGVAQVTVNGVAATFNPANGSWSLASLPLNVGANTITVRAVDNKGNAATASVTVTRQQPDTQPPALTITTPANNSTTQAASITVSGTAVDSGANASGVASVTVNGTAAALNTQNGAWSLANFALSVGTNTITVRAVDNAGNAVTASVTVTRQQPDTQPPALTITTPANNSQTFADKITVSGTATDSGANASGVASVMVNGAAATLNAQNGTWSRSDVPLTLGANQITVQAIDNAGNAATTTITVTRKPVDTQPPVIQITSPANLTTTFDASITVNGTATDEGSGVRSVTVNGVAANYNATTHQWTAVIPLNQGINDIIAIATDNAPTPNSAAANIQITRARIEPPVLNITNPTNGSFLSATALTVAGLVSSNKPDMVITVKVNGADALVAGGQFTSTISLSEGANPINVVATDALGQQSQASVTVTNDLTPPSVSLQNVPPIVEPGGSYTIQALATDAYGIARVDFMVDGLIVSNSTATPYQFSLGVPMSTPPGRTITVAAIAHDLTGATAIATARTVTTGPSGINGYVFDDATGYILQNATARLNGQAAAGTNENGLYNFVSLALDGYVRLTKDGYTPVERVYGLRPGLGTELFDARLTPLDQHPNSLNSNGGTATGDGGRLQVQFGGGSFQSETDVRVTSVSPQGLANLLPFGWSPVPRAVVDVRALNASANVNAFPSPAHLSISQVTGLSTGTLLVLARYDETAHGWKVVARDIVAGANGALIADLPVCGQYAFLLADSGATAPPAPTTGQPLPAGAAADFSALDAATASAVSSPLSALYSAQAKSTVSFLANAPTKLPSGVAIEASFDDTYVLSVDRNPQFVDRPAQDFVLYAYPAATTEQPNRLGAFFIAKPTRTDYALTDLLRANVHVEIRSGRLAQSGALVDATGGIVRGEEGAELEIPASAVSGSQTVFFRRVATEQTGVALPDGYECISAFDLSLTGNNLTQAASISFPAVAGDNTRLVVARIISVGGQRALKVVARAVEGSGRISSTIAGPIVPAGVSLAGVVMSGRYLFIRVPAPFGYVLGAVTNAATNGPASGVKVTTDRTPFVDLTGSNCAYAIIGAAGPDASGANKIGAASVTTDATGQAAASLPAQDAVASVALTISTVPLRVEAVTPANGAGSVMVTTSVALTFNKPINAATVNSSSIKLTTTGGNPVLNSLTVSAGNRSVVLTPSESLSNATGYRVSVTQAVRDIYGNPLSAAFESTFNTTAAIAVSNQLKPEQISISYPNASGIVSIALPAGAVPEGSFIIAVNNSNGSTLSVTAGAGASQLQLAAQVGDDIELLIRQPDGTEYRVKQAAYKRADGFVSVGASGGTVTSADGTLVLQVPAGAISGMAHLKLSALSEAQVTTPRVDEMDPANAPFAGGVKIETQGTFTNTRELHLELPAPANAPEGQRAIFMRPTRATFDGQEADVWETITSGKVENGRIKSTSPPFLGIDLTSLPVATATLALFVFIPIHVRIVTGIVQKANPGRSTIYIGNADCYIQRIGSSHPAIIARSRMDGRFATANYDFDPAAQVTVRATVNGESALGVAAPYQNVETGLIGFTSLYAIVQFPPSSPVANPAQLQLEGRTLNLPPGQTDFLQTSGRVTTDAQIRLKVTATPGVAQINGHLMLNGATVRQLVWTNGPPQQGSSVYETDIEPTLQGSYSVVVNTLTLFNIPATQASATFNFVALTNPNTRPSLPGPPRVLSATPADRAQQVDVGTKVHLEFSEPVKNLMPGQTIYLTRTNSSARIGGTLTTGGLPVDPQANNVSNIDFQPAQRLEGGQEYRITVTSGVVDTDGEPLDQLPDQPNPQDYESTFTTFQGAAISPNPVEDDSYRLAAAGDYLATARYAGGGSIPTGLLNIYDVSQPQAPELVATTNVSHRPLGVAMAEDVFTVNGGGRTFNRIVVVTTTSVPDLVRPTNLWIYSIDDSVLAQHAANSQARPELIGVVSMAIPQASLEMPGHVTIFNKRAYIGDSPRGGCVVIDLEQAMNDFFFATLTPELRDQTLTRAVSPQGGFDQEAQKQKAPYAPPQETSPIYGVSVINQTVQTPTGAQLSPVAYVTSTRQQLISFNFDASKDGLLNYYDGDGDGRDDRILAMTDFNPASYAIDVKAIAGRLINGRSTDLAVALEQTRLWVFDVTNPAAPAQYPSPTFVDLGLAATDSAKRVELEDQYAYVLFDDKVAVIDLSDPAHPYLAATIKDIGTGLRWLAVKDGFVFTLASDTGLGRPGIKVSIGRAVAQVIVYGYEGTNQICGNPVIIDRSSNLMAEPAATFYQVYGHDVPKTSKVVIRQVRLIGNSRNEIILANVNATPGVSIPNVTAGQALWTHNQPIDQSYIYTAEVVLDEGTGAEFHSKQVEIPFSHLISFFPGQLAIQKNPQGQQRGQFAYLLAGTGRVSLNVDNVGPQQLINGGTTPPPNGPQNERPFGQGKETFYLLPRQTDGHYHFTFTAQLKANPQVTDTVDGELTVGTTVNDNRLPGSTVINGVELSNGNLGLSATDVEIKGRGLSLMLTRSYNSKDSNGFNPFGYGWQHNYQIVLGRYAEVINGQPTGKNNYQLFGGDGSGQTFKEAKILNSKMFAEEPYQGTLVKNANGSFDYFTKGRIKYHFSQTLDLDDPSSQNLRYLGNLDYIEDPNGNRITLHYDGYGRMDKVMDPSNRAERALTFEYELGDTPLVSSFPDSPTAGSCPNQNKFKLLLRRLQQSLIGRAWRITKVTGPGGITINYDYDADGNLSKVTRLGSDDISDATNQMVWAYAYNPSPQHEARYEHLLKSVTAPNQFAPTPAPPLPAPPSNRTTTYEYDFTRPLVLPVSKIKLPESVVNIFEYEYTSNDTVITKTKVTDGRGNRTEYQIDSGKYVTSITGPRGDVTTLSWTSFGQIATKLDAEGRQTIITYDANHNPMTQSVTGGGVTISTVTQFDSLFSKPVLYMDGRGYETRYTLDGRGNTIEVKLPTGRNILMDYASNGDLLKSTDQYGFVTTFDDYDPYGNAQTIKRQTTGSNLVITKNTFDVRSRLKKVEDTLGPTVINRYDALDHLVEQKNTDPANYRDEMTMTASYLPEGQIITTQRSGGTQSYAATNKYDNLNRLRVMTETISDVGTFTRNFTYDENSNLKTETDRRGVTTSREYDTLNFLSKITYSGGFGPAIVSWTATDIDKVGNPKKVVNQFGYLTEYEYDGLHRLHITHLPGGYSEETNYDENGNIRSHKDRNGHETVMDYDTVNRLSYTKDPLGHETNITFDDATRTVTRQQIPQGLTEITKADGLGRTVSDEVRFAASDYLTRYTYDDAARKLTVTDPRNIQVIKELSAFNDVGKYTVSGATPSFITETHYAAFGQMKSMVDANGRTTTYGVDGLNRMTTATYQGGFSESWTYDGEGLLTAHTDKRGAAWEMTYDNTGRQRFKKVHEGARVINVDTIMYDDAANTETSTDANGHATTQHYDGLRRVDKITNADGKTQTLVYDGVNLREESDFFDLPTRRTRYDYDRLDRLIQSTDRKGKLTVITYDDTNGLTKTITDRRTNKRVEVYDAWGRLSSVDKGSQRLTSYEYDGDNNRTGVTDGVGNHVTYIYDKLNRVASINHPLNLQTETYTYDGVGNVVAYNDGRGPDVTSTYDALNHVKTRTDGATDTTLFKYDGEGLLTEKTEPKGMLYKTVYEYNAQRSLTKVTDARQGQWVMTYDDGQNLMGVQDALTHAVAYEYDALDRVKKITQPMNLITLYGYDNDSNRTSVTDPKGQVSTLAYDELDRLSTINYTNTTGAGPRAYTYGYDPEGNLTNITETLAGLPPRNYLRSYDARDRLKTTTDPFTRAVTLDYDAANNLKTITDAASRITGYSYDPLNRLQTVTLPGGSPTITYDWYADGLLKQVTYPNGAKREYGYDNADRLTSLTNTLNTQTSELFNYTYDPNSNRASETRKQNGVGTRAINYDYDLLNRLTSANYTTPAADMTPPPPGGSRQVTEATRLKGYGYDKVGNRLTETSQDRTTTITLTTDANGNTTQMRADQNGPVATLNYTYNDLNRLTTLTGAPGGNLTYAYDDNGNLLTVTQGATLQTRYEYDVRDQLRRATDGTSNELAHYDYDYERKRLTRTVGGVSLAYVYAGDDVVNEYTDGVLANRYDLGSNEVVRGDFAGEGARYYFSDAQGSVTGLAQLGANNFFTTRYEYDAWGEYLGSSGASANVIGYTGQRLDSETGLMPLGNGERYYAPGLGRFIQQDSLTGMAMMAQSMNRYAYTQGNPLRYTDPTGHEPDAVQQKLRAARQYQDNHSTGNWYVDAFASYQIRMLQAGYSAAKSFVIGAIDMVAEPARQVSDEFTYLAGSAIGLSMKDMKFMSGSFQNWQGRVMSGESSSRAFVETEVEDVFNMVTLGQVPLITGVIQNGLDYYDGKISDDEYNERQGGALGSELLVYATLKMGGGEAEPEVAAEKTGATPSRSVALAEREGSAAKAATKPPPFEKFKLGELREMFKDHVEDLRRMYEEEGLSVDEETLRRQAREDIEAGVVCFVAGTLIHTRGGLKAIEEIKIGDEVLSYNEQTGQTEYQPVLATYAHDATEILKITIAGEETTPLGVTPHHLFYAHRARDNTGGEDADAEAEVGWLPADQLSVGDWLRRPDGTWVQVVKIEYSASSAIVYNFTVADNHNYFVGLLGALVHNKSCKRKQYMGNTPGKDSVTGRAVIERMEKAGTIRNLPQQQTPAGTTPAPIKKEVYHAGTNQWYPLEGTDMGHLHDCVNKWNTDLRQYGARSPEVRQWMLDSRNYELQPSSINKSNGAKLRERYQPPGPLPTP